jgi:predicted Zn-dependent peptidase
VTEATEQAVDERFGSLGGEQAGSYEPFTPNGPGAAVRIHHKESDQFHLRIGGGGLPIGHPERYVAQLLATVLGGGMSSRLFTEVRERRGLAYYVFAQHGQYLDAGSLYTQAGVDLNRADDAVRTIVGELRGAALQPVPAEELAKAKSFLKGRLVLGLEDPRSIIAFGLRGEVLEGKVREIGEVLAGIDAVTVEQVHEMAQRLFAPEALRLAAIGPFEDEERFKALLAEAA